MDVLCVHNVLTENIIMNNCPFCGVERHNTDFRCPECGNTYPTLAELLAAEEAYELEHSFRGRWQKIWTAPDRKQALSIAIKQFAADLSIKGWIALFVIFAFVFALIITVL